MSEPLNFFAAFQARRLEKIRREFAGRFIAAQTQQQLKTVRDDYHLALAKIGVDPAAPAARIDTAAAVTDRRAPIPATTAFRRSGVMALGVAGCAMLSCVYLCLAIGSSLSYLARRAYHRQNSA